MTTQISKGVFGGRNIPRDARKKCSSDTAAIYSTLHLGTSLATTVGEGLW